MILFFLACAPDDYVPGTGDDTATDTAPATLEGSWRSEGEDVCTLLAGEPFNYTRIDADFQGDGTYTVSSVNTDGQSGTLTGTWSADASTTPGTVTLNQATPYTAVAEGIWQVDGDVLTYEVVQVEPDYDFVPPTPESGFGTTSGPGIEPGVNVQTYRRR